jgi:hypothetical protein
MVRAATGGLLPSARSLGARQSPLRNGISSSQKTCTDVIEPSPHLFRGRAIKPFDIKPRPSDPEGLRPHNSKQWVSTLLFVKYVISAVSRGTSITKNDE